MEKKPDGASRLEIENQRMEERLKILRKVMSVEKAQRESAQASHHWDSAKRDPLAIKKNNKLNLSKVYALWMYPSIIIALSLIIINL
jgi:hypothetical protein